MSAGVVLSERAKNATQLRLRGVRVPRKPRPRRTGQVQRHQRLERRAGGHRSQHALAVCRSVRQRAHRRLQVGHHHRATEHPRREGHHRGERGPIAQVQVPAARRAAKAASGSAAARSAPQGARQSSGRVMVSSVTAPAAARGAACAARAALKLRGRRARTAATPEAPCAARADNMPAAGRRAGATRARDGRLCVNRRLCVNLSVKPASCDLSRRAY